MYLTSIVVDHFKNLQMVHMTPHPKFNLIMGKNAQGKTNLLEAVWLMMGSRSFRGTREKDLLPITSGPLSVEGGNLKTELKVRTGRRIQKMLMTVNETGTPVKKYWCNMVPKRSNEMFSLFHCVIFQPEDINLINGGPDGRRSFLDLCSSQLTPQLTDHLRRYQQILAQRNALLKQKELGQPDEALLQSWDVQLAQLGAQIAVQRAAYVRRLSQVCLPLYQEISGGRENITIHYNSSVYGKDAELLLPNRCTKALQEQYAQRLEQSLQNDLLYGHTTVGAHRDDLELMINDAPAKEFGSQGQKKSLALALKLSQARIHSQVCRNSPVILLDDVMGELDAGRQRVITSVVQDMQMFVTCCHQESIVLPNTGRRYVMKNGLVKEIGRIQ